MYNFFKTTLIVILVVSTVWLLLRINSYLDFRAEQLEGPEANKPVEYRGVRMRQGDFVLHHVVSPRLNRFAKALVQQSSFTLWSLLYALYGMVGNYIYYLMTLVGPRKRQTADRAKAAARFTARTVLAALCGVVSFLLVRWLASPVGKAVGSWIPVGAESSNDWTVHSVSDSFLFLPILAGIFIGTFFKQLEMIFTSVMTFMQKAFSGGTK